MCWWVPLILSQTFQRILRVSMNLWIDIHVLSVMSAITISRTGATVRSPALLPRRRRWTGWRMCTTEGWRITCPWSSSVAPFTAVWTTLCTLSAHLPTFYNNFTQTSREFREFSVCSKFYSDLQYIWIHALKALIHSLFIIHKYM